MKKIGIFLAGMAIVALSWWGYCHGSGFGSGGSGSSSTVDNATIDSRITQGTAAKSLALNANGSNCSAGQAPLGIDASGSVEGCWTPGGDNETLITRLASTEKANSATPVGGTTGTFSGTVTATGGFETPRQASDSVSGTKGQSAKWYEDVDDGDSQYTQSVTALDGNFTDTISGSTRSSTLNFVSSGYIAGLTKSVSLTHASGTHDGDNDAAIMTDSGESFTVNEMVGMTVYNVTDGSSCTITANAATTITCTLAGGTDNNWDTNDVWQVGPGPGQAGTLFYVSAASTIRHPATKNFAAAYYVTAAVVLTIEVADAMTITNATAAAIDAGDTIDSPGTAGAFIVLHNQSATVAQAWGKNGTWVDGGAS